MAFVDSSKVSLKAVLLRNGKKFPSVPLAHAINMKEAFENLKLLLEKIHCEKYNGNICVSFKVIAVLLGFQPGYKKFCCFRVSRKVRTESTASNYCGINEIRLFQDIIR